MFQMFQEKSLNQNFAEGKKVGGSSYFLLFKRLVKLYELAKILGTLEHFGTSNKIF